MQAPKLTHFCVKLLFLNRETVSIHNMQCENKVIWAKLTLSCDSALTLHLHLQEMYEYLLCK